MPELPEVETTVRGLTPVLEGQRLALVEPRRANLRRAFPVDLRQRLTGATVTHLSRRAKYGLIATDRGDTMIFHLGMSGRWRVDPGELLAHDHLLLETDAGRRLALHDPRRFGSVDMVPTADLADWAPFRALGPEPLGPDLTGAMLAAAFEGRRAPIKAMLLDQRIVAGLGNIYVCEALNLARIAPSRAAERIALFRLERLVDAIRTVLLAAIAAGVRRCATMHGLMANSVTSPSSGASMAARASRAPNVPRRSGAVRRVGDPPSGARPASVVDASGLAG